MGRSSLFIKSGSLEIETSLTQAVRAEETLQNRCTGAERERPTVECFPRAIRPPELHRRGQACPHFPITSTSPLIPLSKARLVDLFPHPARSHSCTLSAVRLSNTVKKHESLRLCTPALWGCSHNCFNMTQEHLQCLWRASSVLQPPRTSGKGLEHTVPCPGSCMAGTHSLGTAGDTWVAADGW